MIMSRHSRSRLYRGLVRLLLVRVCPLCAASPWRALSLLATGGLVVSAHVWRRRFATHTSWCCFRQIVVVGGGGFRPFSLRDMLVAFCLVGIVMHGGWASGQIELSAASAMPSSTVCVRGSISGGHFPGDCRSAWVGRRWRVGQPSPLRPPSPPQAVTGAAIQGLFGSPEAHILAFFEKAAPASPRLALEKSATPVVKLKLTKMVSSLRARLLDRGGVLNDCLKYFFAGRRILSVASAIGVALDVSRLAKRGVLLGCCMSSTNTGFWMPPQACVRVFGHILGWSWYNSLGGLGITLSFVWYNTFGSFFYGYTPETSKHSSFPYFWYNSFRLWELYQELRFCIPRNLCLGIGDSGTRPHTRHFAIWICRRRRGRTQTWHWRRTGSCGTRRPSRSCAASSRRATARRSDGLDIG